MVEASGDTKPCKHLTLRKYYAQIWAWITSRYGTDIVFITFCLVYFNKSKQFSTLNKMIIAKPTFAI